MCNFKHKSPNEKLKFFSVILAIGYILFGSYLAYTLPKFKELHNNLVSSPLPFSTQIITDIGSVGHFCLFSTLALLVIIKDFFHYKVKTLNFLFLIILGIMVVFIMNSLARPLMGILLN